MALQSVFYSAAISMPIAVYMSSSFISETSALRIIDREATVSLAAAPPGSLLETGMENLSKSVEDWRSVC